jgi:hypothetical protein
VKKKRTWPAYLVLALCGAPIFFFAAWEFVHDTPVESLKIGLNADGNATLTISRRWTSNTLTGFSLPTDSKRLFEAMGAFAGKAKRDDDGLPICPFHIVVNSDARIGILLEIVVAAVRRKLLDFVLESNGRVANLALPKYEDYVPVTALPPARILTLSSLSPPRGDREWALETFHAADIVVLDGRTLRFILKGQAWWFEYPKEKTDRTIVRDLDDPRVGNLDASEWRALLESAKGKKTIALTSPEEADLSGVDGVYVLAPSDVRAADLIRALAFLTAHEGLKVYIVWPERGGNEDWWDTP